MLGLPLASQEGMLGAMRLLQVIPLPYSTLHSSRGPGMVDEALACS